MKRFLALVFIAAGFAACEKTENVTPPQELQYHYGNYYTKDSSDEEHFEYWDDYTQSFFPEIAWASGETQMNGGVDSFRVDKRKIETGKFNQKVFFRFWTKPNVSYKGMLVFPDKYKSVTTSLTGGVSSTGGWSNMSGTDSLQLTPGEIGRFYYAFYNETTKLVYTKGHYDIEFVKE